jgi:hypothetical protein
LKLQAVKDDATDQNFRQLERQFPIQASEVADSVKELFLQLGTIGSRKVNLGTAKLKWSASQQSNTVEIEHGLPATPLLVLSQLRSFQLTNITLYIPSRSSTKFSLFGFSAASLTAEMEVDWLAIG